MTKPARELAVGDRIWIGGGVRTVVKVWAIECWVLAEVIARKETFRFGWSPSALVKLATPRRQGR